jgi:hypothetical protein
MVVYKPIILALRKQRQEYFEFKAYLGYIVNLGQPEIHREILS